MNRPSPAFDLADIQAKVKAGFFVVTESALEGAGKLRLDRLDIEACVDNLDENDFYKSMPAKKKVGRMQDVYKPTYLGKPIYLKIQLSDAKRVVVISFKKDESR